MKFPKKISPQQSALLEKLASTRLPAFFSSAACLGVLPDIFQSAHPSRVGAAKAICKDCPIRNSCLSWAMDRPEEGIWGGLTKQERLALVKLPSLEEIDELAERREKRSHLVASLPIETLAAEFQVTERTIHRWRARIQKEAS